MNLRSSYCLLLACVGIVSCNEMPPKTHGPIKLGDPSSIVTETDPRRLQDLVTDLKPEIPSPTMQADTAKNQPPATTPDTAQKTAGAQSAVALPTALPAGPGMKAEFKDVSIMIPGLSAKLSGNSNLTNANGAVYTWLSGSLAGNMLRTTGNVTRVSQRYQSIIVLKGKNGNLPLEELTEKTDWIPLNGGNGAYPITGIGETEMTFSDADAGEIRNAIMKSCRTRRLPNKRTQEWVNFASGIHKANQKPMTVTLRSLMWKIDGKDPNGKLFSKQIRIDIPL